MGAWFTARPQIQIRREVRKLIAGPANRRAASILAAWAEQKAVREIMIHSHGVGWISGATGQFRAPVSGRQFSISVFCLQRVESNARRSDPKLDPPPGRRCRAVCGGVKPLASNNPRIENPVAGGDACRRVLRHFCLRVGQVLRGPHGLFVVHPLAGESIDEG